MLDGEGVPVYVIGKSPGRAPLYCALFIHSLWGLYIWPYNLAESTLLYTILEMDNNSQPTMRANLVKLDYVRGVLTLDLDPEDVGRAARAQQLQDAIDREEQSLSGDEISQEDEREILRSWIGAARFAAIEQRFNRIRETFFSLLDHSDHTSTKHRCAVDGTLTEAVTLALRAVGLSDMSVNGFNDSRIEFSEQGEDGEIYVKFSSWRTAVHNLWGTAPSVTEWTSIGKTEISILGPKGIVMDPYTATGSEEDEEARERMWDWLSRVQRK